MLWTLHQGRTSPSSSAAAAPAAYQVGHPGCSARISKCSRHSVTGVLWPADQRHRRCGRSRSPGKSGGPRRGVGEHLHRRRVPGRFARSDVADTAVGIVAARRAAPSASEAEHGRHRPAARSALRVLEGDVLDGVQKNLDAAAQRRVRRPPRYIDGPQSITWPQTRGDRGIQTRERPQRRASLLALGKMASTRRRSFPAIEVDGACAATCIRPTAPLSPAVPWRPPNHRRFDTVRALTRRSRPARSRRLSGRLRR